MNRNPLTPKEHQMKTRPLTDPMNPAPTDIDGGPLPFNPAAQGEAAARRDNAAAFKAELDAAADNYLAKMEGPLLDIAEALDLATYDRKTLRGTIRAAFRDGFKKGHNEGCNYARLNDGPSTADLLEPDPAAPYEAKWVKTRSFWHYERDGHIAGEAHRCDGRGWRARGFRAHSLGIFPTLAGAKAAVELADEERREQN